FFVFTSRIFLLFFFFSSRRRHTRFSRDWSSDVCSSDLAPPGGEALTELLTRLRAFLASIEGGDALLITHAGPIRALHHLVLGESLDEAFRRPVGHGQLLRLG